MLNKTLSYLNNFNLKNTINTSRNVIKNVYNFATKEKIPFSEKQQAAQRMLDFINSEDWLNRARSSNLTDREIFNMRDAIIKKINNGNFPAYRMKMDNALGASLNTPDWLFGGIYIKKGLGKLDFLNTIDHELAHYSTAGLKENHTPPRWFTGINPVFGKRMM